MPSTKTRGARHAQHASCGAECSLCGQPAGLIATGLRRPGGPPCMCRARLPSWCLVPVLALQARPICLPGRPDLLPGRWPAGACTVQALVPGPVHRVSSCTSLGGSLAVGCRGCRAIGTSFDPAHQGGREDPGAAAGLRAPAAADDRGCSYGAQPGEPQMQPRLGLGAKGRPEPGVI